MLGGLASQGNERRGCRREIYCRGVLRRRRGGEFASSSLRIYKLSSGGDDVNEMRRGNVEEMRRDKANQWRRRHQGDEERALCGVTDVRSWGGGSF